MVALFGSCNREGMESLQSEMVGTGLALIAMSRYADVRLEDLCKCLFVVSTSWDVGV